MIRVREYVPADARATLDVFVSAVTMLAARDYTPEQIAAWVEEPRDLEAWNARREGLNTVVAEVDDEVVGFTDASAEGHIDMLFVSASHARRGVASALLAHIEHRARDAGAAELTADVSITARPFFEANGFTVVAEQHPEIRGMRLTNFRMRKTVAAS